jgi:hypothetical protein
LASTVAFASPVFAEWTKVDKNVDGDTFYIDYDTVKENNGYVYYWRLSDYLKPSPQGNLSAKVLKEIDCDIPRKSRILSDTYYTQPMASGSVNSSSNDASEWIYPSPNSVADTMANAACDYAGK